MNNPGTSARQRQPVLPESIALAGIGCLDMLATLYLIATRQGTEANPLMAAALQAAGPVGFIAAKVTLLAVPLTIAELARRQHPDFVRTALRIGIILYSLIYILGYLHINTR